MASLVSSARSIIIYNSISGLIPSELGTLTNMTVLSLGSNTFSEFICS
jgi:hypothetical protein